VTTFQLARRTALPLPRAARWLFADRMDFVLAAALMIGVWTSNVLGMMAILDEPAAATGVRVIFQNFAESLAGLLTIAVVARVAASWTLVGWRRHASVALSMALALSAKAAIELSVLPANSGISDVGVGIANPAIAMSVAALWFPLGLLLAAQFHRGAQVRAATARLQSLLSAQQLARRRFAESRLQAIQSRIDPKLLFEFLSAARRSYESDVERAEQLLDELTAFLRVTLTRASGTAWTLGREADIAVTLARMRNLADASHNRFDSALPDRLAALEFPPGVVLPLVDSMLGRNGGHGGSIELTGQWSPEGFVLDLAGPVVPSETNLGKARAALAEYYGPRAAIESGVAAGRAAITVRVPTDGLSIA
jgi:hypothetical protein